MSKITIKRMYDVIAELQDQSLHVQKNEATTTTTATCSQLLAATLGVDLPTTKRMRREEPSTADSMVLSIQQKENPQPESNHNTKQSTTHSRVSDDDSHSSHLRHIPEAIANVRSVYLYGLQKVSELQDLQHAPDAILPGNLVYEEEYEIAMNNNINNNEQR